MLSDLHASRVRLVFISCRGDEKKAREYLRRFNAVAPFPAELFIDPVKRTHKALRLRYGVYRSLVTPIVKALGQGVPVAQMLEGVRLGWRNFWLAGDSWQQGGTAVFLPPSDDPNGSRCTYLHLESNPADHRPMRPILLAAGVPSDRAKDVDYVASLEKFLNHRRAGRAPEDYGANIELGPFALRR